MTLSTEASCVDQTYCRRRMAKRLKTDEEKHAHELGGEQNVQGSSEAQGVRAGEEMRPPMDDSGDSSVIQPSDMLKAVIMAADNDTPELNRVEFARTLSDDDDAEAYEPIFDESELPPRPVKHKKKKAKEGKSSKHSTSDKETARADTKK